MDKDQRLIGRSTDTTKTWAQVLSPKNLYAVNESMLGRKRYKRNSNTFDHILQVEKEELIISEYLVNAQKKSEKPNAW